MVATLRTLCLVVVALGWLVLAGPARADEPRRAGTVRLEAPGGGRGPITLRPDREGFSGEIVIVNDGKEPLVVSRIAPRGDASDPRVPPKLAVRIADGTIPASIPPGASRKAVVTWTPEPTTRLRQLFGHVVVTTSDEHTGDVAMGVRAQVGAPIEGRLLTILIAIPFGGALLTFLLRLLGRRGDRSGHAIGALALALQTALAVHLYRGFQPDVSRIAGNDGLQLVEHAVWIRSLSIELYLGVDGIGALGLVVTSVVAFLGLLPHRSIPSGAAGYHAALLVLDAAMVGARGAFDGVVFVLFAAVAVAAATLLVGSWGGGARREAATRLAVVGGLALLLLSIALVALARNADATYLVDGTKAYRTFNLAELSRVPFGAKAATFLGGPIVKVSFALVLASALLLLAAFPAHGWLSDVLAEAPAATGILVATVFPTLGLCALLRIGCAVLPEGMRWASGVVVALGAVSAAYGALLALGETDLRRLAACATTTQSGFVLLGAASLTPQGLSGAIVTGIVRVLACGVFLLLASSIYERAKTSDAARLGGIAAQMPGWATALAAGGLAQAGVLGLGGAWGPLLALLGVLASYAPLAIVSAIALVVIAAAHLSALARVVFAPIDPAWSESELLQPSGGRFSDLGFREWIAVAPLVLAVVVLGLWPAPLLGRTTGVVRDLAVALSPDQAGGL